MSISPIYQEYLELQALSKINSYSLAKIEGLLVIAEYNEKGDFFPSRSQIIRDNNMKKDRNPKTGTRWTDDFHEDGLIIKTRDPKNKYKTCRYQVTQLYEKLSPYIRNIYVTLKYAPLPISLLFSVAEPDVPPYKSFTEKETSYCSLVGSLSNSPSLSYYREPRATQTGTIKKIQIGGVMELDWISPELKGVTELLNLNKWGQIKLSAFPKQALQHAAVVFRSSKSPKKDPFHWFREVCNEWCMKNNVSPDYGLLYRLEAKYEMPENPNYVLSHRPSIIAIAPKKAEAVSLVKKMHPDWESKTFLTEEEIKRNRLEAIQKFEENGEFNIFQSKLIEGWKKQYEIS